MHVYIYIYMYTYISTYRNGPFESVYLFVSTFEHSPLFPWLCFGAVSQSCLKTRQITWWRHEMDPFSALLAICAENSPVPGEFPTQRPVTRSFDVFFDLRLNKRLSKQSWGWCLRRHSAHYDVIIMHVDFLTWLLIVWWCITFVE